MTRTCLLLAVLFGLLAQPSPGLAQDKVHPWLMDRAMSGDKLEFLVIMKESADLSPAARTESKAEKGRQVFGALVRTARESQASLQSWLKARGVQFRSFHVVNALLVKGDRQLIETIARREDVARIEGNPSIKNNLPLPAPPMEAPTATNAVGWNISQTKAPDLWTLGFTGSGIVIGGQDTGYRWTHQALKGKYRGWDGTTANHDYNWHDAIHSGGGSCGADSPVPCDDYGHGTHTMGTAIGDDGGANQIGMAPGARWIGCRNMNVGHGSPATYLECFEFFLAPYPVGGNPSQGDPAKAPDVTVNSWSCTPGEGCSALTLEAAVNAMKAAGIMTVVSAGNDGPSCGSLTNPPAIYGSAYSVGSTTDSYGLSSFSNRGPAGTTGLVKPDIVAPGNGIYSAWHAGDSSYATMGGTSMAGPHVAGGVALLWSASPAYKNYQDATEQLINATATKLTAIVEGCGGDYTVGPNNSWGNGFLNVLAAHNAATTHTLSLSIGGSGSGTVSITPSHPAVPCTISCTRTFPKGTVLALTPTAAGSSVFTGWSGCDAVSGNQCGVTMNANRTVSAAFWPLVAGVTLAPDKSSPRPVGTQVTFTAAASGGSGAYQYQFWLRNTAGTWSIARSYSSTPTWAWNTAGLPVGTYTVQVWTRNAGSSASYEAYRSMSYTLSTPPPASSVTLAPDKSPPRPVGTQVIFTAAASGGSGAYQYQYWLRNTAGTWSIARSYGATPTWAWNTTGLTAGTYTVQVWARNAGSSASYEAYRSIGYALAPAVTVTVTPASPQPRGTSITFNAAVAGDSGTHLYQFYWRNPGTGVWTVGQAYSAASSWTWNTTAGMPAGIYTVQVWAKKSGSTAAYDYYKSLNYTLQ